MIKILIILILFSIPASAQSARVLSDVTVYSSLTLDTIDSFRYDNRSKAFKCQALRLGINNGVNQLVKHLIHKDRPDHSDNKSFYSSHTSNAFVNSGWNYSIGLTLGITTGILRVKAKKHDWIDVSVGALSGLLIQQICSKD